MHKVIVGIQTYNLEEYIAQALDSVLMQKTTFEYQILVADDCSTDKTKEILQEYQEKHPERIRILWAERNMGSLASSNRIFHKIDCEYFTLLDGDDYWVGEDRLQKQVDFLDTHPEYTMCAGNTQYLVNEVPGDLLVKGNMLGKGYCFQDYLNDTMPFFHTSAILVRNVIFKNGLPDCYFTAVDTFRNCALRGEDFRRILHLEQGPLYAMNDLMSAYRIHAKGVWQGSTNIRRELETTIGYDFYAEYFGDKYGDSFSKRAQQSYRSLMTSLILEYGLRMQYPLNPKDSALLTGFMNHKAKQNKESKSGRKFSSRSRRIISIFMKLMRI